MLKRLKVLRLDAFLVFSISRLAHVYVFCECHMNVVMLETLSLTTKRILQQLCVECISHSAGSKVSVRR